MILDLSGMAFLCSAPDTCLTVFRSLMLMVVHGEVAERLDDGVVRTLVPPHSTKTPEGQDCAATAGIAAQARGESDEAPHKIGALA